MWEHLRPPFPHHPGLLRHLLYALVPSAGTGGPNWAEQVTAWATLALAIGVAVAGVTAVFAWRSMRLAGESLKEDTKTRHAQIAVQLGRVWETDDMWRIRQRTKNFSPGDLARYYERENTANSDAFYQLVRFANFFEDLGVLNKLGILGEEWVDECLGSSVIDYRDMWADVIGYEQGTRRTTYENWVRLADKIRTRRGGS
ncbi:MAG: DUF4760 domain-containing protein [Acidimicrobiales bacterium]